MNNETYNLIDTALKIGLGALIASISSYLLTKFNYKSEAKKELYRRHLDSIEKISESAEDYFQKWTYFVTSVKGLSRNTIEKDIPVNPRQMQKIKERDLNLVESRNNKMSAISRLKLLGLDDVSIILEETGIIEKELRDLVVFDEIIPPLKTIDSIHSKMKNKRDSFYKTLNKHYSEKKFTSQ